MKLQNIDPALVFFTSDTHAFHKNIVRGTTTWDINSRTGNELKVRDFADPDIMTQTMADRINSVVPSNGILFHLGDWSFAGEPNIKRFRDMLDVNTVHLITGNHDHFQERGNWDSLFASRQKYLEVNINHLNFCLFHFPISSWNGVGKGVYHLHGHQHLVGDDRFGNGRMMDVGVDGNDLYPYRLTEIIDLLKDRRHISNNDHHV